MKHILALLVFSFSIAMLNSQSQQATIKIEKTEDGETVIIEKDVEIKDGRRARLFGGYYDRILRVAKL